MIRAVWELVRAALREFVREDPLTQAAALSYTALLSLAPLLLMLVSVVGLVYGEEAARGEIVERLRGLVGADAAHLAQTVLAQAHREGGGGFSAIVSGVFLLVGASAAFVQLQSAIDHVWGVEAPPQPLWTLLRGRLAGFLFILVLGVAMIALLVASSVVAALAALPGTAALGWLWRWVDLGASFGLMTALFAVLFKMLPHAKVHWTDVWIGAAMTALLFTVGRWAIGLYLGRAGIGSAYGAAGSAIVMMVWIYYSTLILLFGAEMTQVYARRYGADVSPLQAEDAGAQRT